MNSNKRTSARLGALIGTATVLAAMATTTGCSKSEKATTTTDPDATPPTAALTGPADAGTASAAPAPTATGTPGPILCKSQFALCNQAPCEKVGDAYRCAPCIVYKDEYSFGNSTCEARAARLLSEFSTLDAAHLKNMKCPAGHVWANCLDAPCEDLGNGKAACTCPAGTPPGANATFGGDCDKKSCDKTVWSAFAASETEKFVKAYAAALKKAGGKLVEPKTCGD